jgi:hypothetical protein
MFFSTVAVAALAAFATASPVKRGFGGRATFYATGLGACGDWNNDGDMIVALNSAQYIGGYPGPECGRQIQIWGEYCARVVGKGGILTFA